MEFRILGPLEIRDGERAVSIPSGKQRALLALLVLNRDETVSTDRLVDELWGEAPPPTAAKIVQNYVSQLRRSLGDDRLIVTRGSGYALELEAGELDVDRFETLLESGRSELAEGDPRRAAETLRRALAVWRGPPLSDFSFDSFAQTEIARLDERRLVAEEERIEADLALGRHQDLVGDLEALIARNPLRERLRGQLMLALYRSGRQSEALRAYQDTRRRLVDELGIEPSPALQQLEKAILTQDPALEAPAAPRGIAQRARRPAVPLVAGAVLLAAAVAAGLFQLLRDSDSSLTELEGNTVGLIDPDSGEISAQIPVGSTPTSISVGEGAVWVLNADDQTISRIDPESKAVKAFGIGSTPTDLAAGGGALWVGRGSRRPGDLPSARVATALSQIDPELGSQRRAITLPRTGGVSSNVAADHIAVAPGAVWVINPDFTVSRLDPESGEIVATIRNVDAIAIAADRAAAWVLNTDGSVARIRANGETAGRRITVPAATLSDIAVGDGSAWLAAPYDGTVWRIHLTPRLVLRPIDAAVDVNRIAYGDGSVWAASSLQGILVRIEPETERVVRTIAVGNTPRDLAIGEGGVWVSVAGRAGEPLPSASSVETGAVTPLPQSFCDAVFYGGEGTPEYLVVSDLPLQGGGRFSTLQMSEAVAFVLRRHRFRAGEFRVAYQSCDDSTSQTGLFDFEKCAANAKAYAANDRVLGVVGPYNSACAVAQIPVANRSSLPIVSPSTSVVDLTRASPLAPRNALARLYPTGRRNFVRVSASEDHQSAANALLVRQLGAMRVFVLTDGEPGFGLAKAVFFRRSARKLGLAVTGFRRWDPRARGYGRLAQDVAAARPDAVFLGGGLYTNGGALIRALRARLGDVPIMAPEFLPVAALFETAGSSARGTYVSLLGLTLDGLPPAGRRFVREFGATQPGGRVDVSAVYAAEAAEVLLAAIARSDATRESVLRELFRLRVDDGLLGDYRITRTGDTTSNAITILRAARPGGLNIVQGYEGAEPVSVIRPPARLVS